MRLVLPLFPLALAFGENSYPQRNIQAHAHDHNGQKHEGVPWNVDVHHRRLIDVLNLQALFMRNKKIIHIVQAILRPMVMVLG